MEVKILNIIEEKEVYQIGDKVTVKVGDSVFEGEIESLNYKTSSNLIDGQWKKSVHYTEIGAKIDGTR